MNYDFLICGRHVRFEIPWELNITPESRPFLISPEASAEPDLTLSIRRVDQLAPPPEGGVWHADCYYVSDPNGRKRWHCPARGLEPYCCVWERGNTVFCDCVRGQEGQIVYTKNLLELLGLENFLLRFEGFMLHASLVDWAGKGILFCAPSGTGKSTQAELWRLHTGSQILNGDRAGIRCEDGVWMAWGLPYAGSSGIYRNRSVPVRAVVLLSQGRENAIARVSPLTAFRGLLPQCNAQRWDGGFMNRLTGVLAQLIESVPVYQLACKPDLSAVELLRDTLMKEA